MEKEDRYKTTPLALIYMRRHKSNECFGFGGEYSLPMTDNLNPMRLQDTNAPASWITFFSMNILYSLTFSRITKIYCNVGKSLIPLKNLSLRGKNLIHQTAGRLACAHKKRQKLCFLFLAISGLPLQNIFWISRGINYKW